MSICKHIEKLTSLSGISGFEHSISEYLKTELAQITDSIEIDNLGNVIALKKGKNSQSKVMIEAHIDEIGMLVSGIDDNGFLLVKPVGGIDPRILPALSVKVHGKDDYIGVIGAKPPHMMTSDEYTKVVGFDKLYIDVGMTKAEADENIGIGAPVTFMGDVSELSNGFLASKCMDDRACVATVLDCLEKLKNENLNFDLYFCACVQEEVGLRGSLTAAHYVNPDFAIALDVTHAKTPDESKGSFDCGSGPAVCVGPNIHSGLVKKFKKVLCENEIAFEIEVEGGNTGTDAWSIQTSREGIPTLLASIPLKYMHTPVETLCLSDCESLSNALSAFLKSFENTEDVLC